MYCATGCLKPIQEACAGYQKEYGVHVRIEPDSSGSLLSRVRVTPDRVDLYLSGEEWFMTEARRQGLVAEVLPFARQHVVLAVQPGNPKRILTFRDLLRDNVRVVLPNPELTATAKAAHGTAGSGEWESLLDRQRVSTRILSFVGTVTEAAQAAKIGTADATLAWDATARTFGLEIVEVPAVPGWGPRRGHVGDCGGDQGSTAALHLARYLTARDRGQLAVEEVISSRSRMPMSGRTARAIAHGRRDAQARDRRPRQVVQRAGRRDDRHGLQRMRHPHRP